MISPLLGGIMGRRYNRTLHGRSVYRKADVPGHNVVMGWSKPGVGDALDVFVPAGAPVFAMHAGRINRIADRGGRLSCIYIAGKGITTVYAHLHIRERIALGMRIHEGDLIGWVGRELKDPHLHLEVWSNGHSITATNARSLATKINSLLSTA